MVRGVDAGPRGSKTLAVVVVTGCNSPNRLCPKTAPARDLQGNLAHARQPPPLGPPYDPRYSPTVGSREGSVSYE